MKIKRLNIGVSSTIILIALAFCQLSSAIGASIVSTDKNVYNYGETIKVNFSNAPGNDRDWICIAPAGSPDTEGGDYKNMPKGLSQGVLTYDSPAPGKYEVRAYYDYDAKGYVVAGRYAFTVSGGADYKKMMSQRMERKINSSNPLEANIRAGEGLLYIFREPAYSASLVEAEIKANGKPIVVMSDSKYFLFPVNAGDVTFTTGSLTTWNIQQAKNEEVWTMQSGQVAIKVKAGYVYYLKLSVLYRAGYAASLEYVPHEDGAKFIESYHLTPIK